MTAESLTLPASEDHADSPVRIGLLGLTEILDAEKPTSRFQRKTFALLAVNTPNTVPIGSFYQELWDGDLPETPLQCLQSLMMVLRRLAPWVREAIVNRHSGYALVVPALDVDAARFAHLVAGAKARLGWGDVRAAEDTLRAAMSLWRGPPLEDVAAGPLLSSWAEGMRDVYLTAQELMFDIDLRAGRHRELIDPLRQMLREDPTREDTAAKLMTALFRSQRKREALEVYTLTRAALDELGLEPGTPLERLQQQVLQGDRTLEWNGER